MARFTNQASVIYADSVVVDSNVVEGEVIEPITLTKISTTEVYSRGDKMTFIVSIVNDRDDKAFTGLTLRDDLGRFERPGTPGLIFPLTYEAGSAKLFSDGVLVPIVPGFADGFIVFADLDLRAGGNLMLIYEVMVNDFAPIASGDEGEIINTAYLRGDGIAGEISASSSINVRTAPELVVTKNLRPIPVNAGEILTYTIRIENFGNTAADESAKVVVTDTFDPVLSSLTVTLDGEPLERCRDYVYNQSTGEFRTLPGVVTVGAAEYSIDPVTLETIINPGSALLEISGRI